MPFMVVYFSRGGKTGKVAAVIAQELGCESADLAKGQPDISGVDLLVAGSGTYGGMPGQALLEFLKGIPQAKGGRAAIFVTSAGPDPKSLPRIGAALEERGYSIVSTFHCRGQLMLANRGHPDEKDLENARAFARDLKK